MTAAGNTDDVVQLDQRVFHQHQPLIYSITITPFIEKTITYTPIIHKYNYKSLQTRKFDYSGMSRFIKHSLTINEHRAPLRRIPVGIQQPLKHQFPDVLVAIGGC